MNYCDTCGPNSGLCWKTGVCQHKVQSVPFYPEVAPDLKPVAPATDKPKRKAK